MSDVKKEEKIPPLEVKITNHKEREVTPFDDIDSPEYENMYPSNEQIKEYEDEEE